MLGRAAEGAGGKATATDQLAQATHVAIFYPCVLPHGRQPVSVVWQRLPGSMYFHLNQEKVYLQNGPEFSAILLFRAGLTDRRIL